MLGLKLNHVSKRGHSCIFYNVVYIPDLDIQYNPDFSRLNMADLVDKRQDYPNASSKHNWIGFISRTTAP